MVVRRCQGLGRPIYSQPGRIDENMGGYLSHDHAASGSPRTAGRPEMGFGLGVDRDNLERLQRMSGLCRLDNESTGGVATHHGLRIEHRQAAKGCRIQMLKLSDPGVQHGRQLAQSNLYRVAVLKSFGVLKSGQREHCQRIARAAQPEQEEKNIASRAADKSIRRRFQEDPHPENHQAAPSIKQTSGEMSSCKLKSSQTIDANWPGSAMWVLPRKCQKGRRMPLRASNGEETVCGHRRTSFASVRVVRKKHGVETKTFFWFSPH